MRGKTSFHCRDRHSQPNIVLGILLEALLRRRVSPVRPNKSSHAYCCLMQNFTDAGFIYFVPGKLYFCFDGLLRLIFNISSNYISLTAHSSRIEPTFMHNKFSSHFECRSRLHIVLFYDGERVDGAAAFSSAINILRCQIRDFRIPRGFMKYRARRNARISSVSSASSRASACAFDDVLDASSGTSLAKCWHIGVALVRHHYKTGENAIPSVTV